jgi:hypothetical protein
MPMAFPSRGFRRTRERASGLLFAFGADDLSSTVLTGQSLSITRATGRTVVDSGGRVSTIGHSAMPWSAWYNTTEAAWEPVLDVSQAATNLCLQSENFGTTWAAIGTPTRTAAAQTCGEVALDLLGDDAAGTLEGYSQVVTYNNTIQKAVSCIVKKGTSTSSVIRLRDTTASANRLLATITWSGSVPSVAMTTGFHYGTIPLANGCYRLLFQSTSVTHTPNVNQLEVYPATTSGLAIANTGTLYIGAMQTLDQTRCAAYYKTTTGAAGSAPDYITSTVSWAPQDFTVYARVQRPPQADLTGGVGFAGYICYLGTGPGAGFALYFTSATPTLVGGQLFDTAGGSVGANASVPASGVLDVAVKFVNVVAGGTVQVDVGSGYGAASPAAGVVSGAWSTSTLVIGGRDSVADQMDCGIRRLVIASGARTLAEMRGLAV